MARKLSSEVQSIELNAEQQERAERILRHLQSHADQHLKEMATLLASKPDCEVFGQVEFQIRDLVNKIAVEGIQANVDARKKGVPGS